MCPPVLTAVSGVMSAIGAIQSNGARQAQYKAEAEAQRREAGVQNQIGAQEARKTENDLKRVVGSNIAGNVANGISLSGSALDVLQDTAREGDLDLQTIKWNAGARSDKSKYAASVADMNRKQVAKAAPFEFLSPILDSATKIGGMYAKAA